MSLSTTDDQRELSRLTRRFLDDVCSPEDLRRTLVGPADYDAAAWQRLAVELGLTGLTIDERYAGAGMGPAELAVVMEQLGRSLYAGPFTATVALAGQTLAVSGDETAKEQWLPQIASGSMTATLALTEPDGTWDLAATRTLATHEAGVWRLRGTKAYVLDGHSADLILVTAQAEDGLGLFAVEGEASSLTRTRVENLDPTRPLATVEFDGTSASRIGHADATAWLGHALDLIRAAIAAEQVGGAAQCLDTAVSYAQNREQFERAIGSFQAIKHKCAQLLVEIESARSAVQAATAMVARPSVEASIASTVAHIAGSRAFTHAAKENIQIHGGLGFTWEHGAHLYLRRAKATELLFGTPREERSRLARLTGLRGDTR